jgi:hypothetical protein
MTEQEFYIGQTFEIEYPPEAAIWCNENNAVIKVSESGEYIISEVPEPTEAEKLQREIDELQHYLDETDWYVTRQSETGLGIPEEVKDKRQQARDRISNNREYLKRLV